MVLYLGETQRERVILMINLCDFLPVKYARQHSGRFGDVKAELESFPFSGNAFSGSVRHGVEDRLVENWFPTNFVFFSLLLP